MAEIELLDSPNRPASVPRRFGVGMLLILMTGLAVLFAFLSWLNARPIMMIVIAGMICAVSMGQVLLFEGKRPRLASIVAGLIGLPPLIIVGALFELKQGDLHDRNLVLDACLGAFVAELVLGLPLSYAAGGVVSGVFLITEQLFGEKRAEPKIELRPITEADLDLLHHWLKQESLALAWTAGACASFANLESLLNYLNLPAPEATDRFCFKALALCPHEESEAIDEEDAAVAESLPRERLKERMIRYIFKALASCPHENSVAIDEDDAAVAGSLPLERLEERMIGYAELTRIDAASGRFRIGRAIVDPEAPQRPQASVAMLIALCVTAFDTLGMKSLEIRTPPNQILMRGCIMQVAQQATELWVVEEEPNVFVLGRWNTIPAQDESES